MCREYYLSMQNEKGEISRLNKELILVALAVYIKCEYCIAALAHSAVMVQNCLEAFANNS